MEKEILNMRIVPFVKEVKKEKKGKIVSVNVDNLSGEEHKRMSCDSKIFELVGDNLYTVCDTPITFKGTGLRLRLCYVYDELTQEEQEKYFDRSEVIATIAKNEVMQQAPVKNVPKRRIRERK